MSQVSDRVHREMEEAFGFVPSFAREVPPEQLEGFWNIFSKFQLSEETAIPPKYKELIGLGVASQIPCTYCMTFHKEAAKMNGATERELREAIGMAANTRFGSTILNGFQQDVDEFHDEVRRIVQHATEHAPAKRGPSAPVRR